MNAIIIIGSVQAFFFSFLVFSKNENKLHDKILGFWLFCMGLQLLLKYINFNNLYIFVPWILGLNGGFPLLHGPFLFLYINTLTKNYRKLRKIDLLHFLPFLVFYIYLFPVLFFPNEAKIEIFIYGQNFEMKYIPLFIMILLSGPIYIIRSLISFKKHRGNITNFFSFNEEVGLKWLYYLILGLLAIWIAIFISYALTEIFNIVTPVERDVIIYIIFVMYVLVLGFKGFKQGSIFLNINFEKTLRDSNNTSPTTSDKESKVKDADLILERLQTYMETEKPYLEEKLSIVKLSDKMDIPYYILSQVINDKLNQNFFDYINTFRVNEAKAKLCNPKFDHYTVLGIALECGFNSKASFNRIFKLKTSLTPTQYKNSLKN